MARYLYSELSNLVQARINCSKDFAYHQSQQTATAEWFDKHTSRIEELVREHMPSGGGFDSGTTLDLDSSHADKLVFQTSYHHMDEAGGYDGWTEHTVTVTPSLMSGYHLRVGGRDRNGIKEYIGETFHNALSMEVSK
jgi:hypothetical protein